MDNALNLIPEIWNSYYAHVVFGGFLSLAVMGYLVNHRELPKLIMQLFALSVLWLPPALISLFQGDEFSPIDTARGVTFSGMLFVLVFFSLIAPSHSRDASGGTELSLTLALVGVPMQVVFVWLVVFILWGLLPSVVVYLCWLLSKKRFFSNYVALAYPVPSGSLSEQYGRLWVRGLPESFVSNFREGAERGEVTISAPEPGNKRLGLLFRSLRREASFGLNIVRGSQWQVVSVREPASPQEIGPIDEMRSNQPDSQSVDSEPSDPLIKPEDKHKRKIILD